MATYHSFANAAFADHVGLNKIGEVLRNEFNVVAGPLPEPLAGLLAQLEGSTPSTVVALGETCLRPFDRLDNVIRRTVVSLVDK